MRQANDEGRILPLLRRVHDDMPKYFRGPLLAFWVFQSMRGYGIALRDGNSRMMGELPHFTCPFYLPHPAQKPWYFGCPSHWLGWLHRRTSR